MSKFHIKYYFLECFAAYSYSLCFYYFSYIHYLVYKIFDILQHFREKEENNFPLYIVLFCVFN